MKKQFDVYVPKEHILINGKWIPLNGFKAIDYLYTSNQSSSTFLKRLLPERVIDLSNRRN